MHGAVVLKSVEQGQLSAPEHGRFGGNNADTPSFFCDRSGEGFRLG